MLLMVNQAELARKREEKGLTRHKLSLLAGLSSNAVFRMETKPYRVSSLRAKVVADVLGCDVADLFYPIVNHKAV